MTINTSYNPLSSGYYSLAQYSGAVGSSSSASNAAQQSSANSAADSLSAYMLDLSPEAKNYLNIAAVTSTVSDQFALSSDQQKKIDAILEKYKNQSYTQDTFNKIQVDLQAAGLSPDQLAGQAQAKSFSPTQALLNALNGRNVSNDNTNENPADKYDNQKKNFVQQIAEKFQKIAASTNG